MINSPLKRLKDGNMHKRYNTSGRESKKSESIKRVSWEERKLLSIYACMLHILCRGRFDRCASIMANKCKYDNLYLQNCQK